MLSRGDNASRKTEDKKMTHTHMLAIIARFGFSTNCRKKTALEAVRDCAEKGNVQAIRCLEQLSEEGVEKITKKALDNA